MAKDSELIGADEAGDVLGISGRRVRVLIDDGVIPAIRVGKSYIIRRADLAKVPKDRKPGPKPKAKKRKGEK